jgi:hypothetical protein
MGLQVGGQVHVGREAATTTGVRGLLRGGPAGVRRWYQHPTIRPVPTGRCQSDRCQPAGGQTGVGMSAGAAGVDSSWSQVAHVKSASTWIAVIAIGVQRLPRRACRRRHACTCSRNTYACARRVAGRRLAGQPLRSACRRLAGQPLRRRRAQCTCGEEHSALYSVGVFAYICLFFWGCACRPCRLIGSHMYTSACSSGRRRSKEILDV